MKKLIALIPLFISTVTLAQNITVNSSTYTPQELIENILIESGCIGDVTVTNTVSGNFNNGQKSFGYFDRNGSNFPFENGVVMSTGQLNHVPGPNNNLSDDDAPSWGSDPDLENILGVNNTLNATVIEFDFTPNANSISFRYIFASEEYQEGDGNTCIYSDVFAFLIKPLGGQYENIAVVPGTDIPVQVTTVHPEIPGSCEAENEEYFGSWNGVNTPINFNGQTKALTATATVTPNTTYHIKLIIADEANYRYDSAVFLEGGSFNIDMDLGEDVTGNDALCEGETYTLSPQSISTDNIPQNYSWYKVNSNGSETLLTQGPTEDSYEVSDAGTYKLVIDFGDGCTVEDSIRISYYDFSDLSDQVLYECDPDNDGLTTYGLPSYNGLITQQEQNYNVQGFYLSLADAQVPTDPIPTPGSFQNTSSNQEIYARVESSNGCFTILTLTLSTPATNTSTIYLVSCIDQGENTLTYTLNDAIPEIENELGQPVSSANFYGSTQDVISESNPLPSSLNVNIADLPKNIYAKIESNQGCQGTFTIRLEGIISPEINPNYQPSSFCANEGNVFTLESGIIGNESDYTYQWNTGETTPTIAITQSGDYSVTITKTSSINGEEYNCSSTNVFSITASQKATISYHLSGDLDNTTVEIIANGNGDYVYAVDNPYDFQQDPVFTLSSGQHTLYVKDLNGCGTASKTITVLGYMRFFTPNNDGINDFWKLSGNGQELFRVKKIHIFDRFGKLIKTLSPYDSWDGTFHGKKLPSTDYWFYVDFLDAPDFKGHFSLIR